MSRMQLGVVILGPPLPPLGHKGGDTLKCSNIETLGLRVKPKIFLDVCMHGYTVGS